jgi:copper chaperone
MVTIKIANMSCGGCAKGVLATLREVAPGAETRLHLDRREVEVEAVDAAPIVAALRLDNWDASAAG